LYEAKRAGGNGACGYSPDRDTRFDGPVLDFKPGGDHRTVVRGEDPFDLSLPAGAAEPWDPVLRDADR
jgi:hypothetical protein